jgi:hypothetical protein
MSWRLDIKGGRRVCRVGLLLLLLVCLRCIVERWGVGR